MPLIITRDAPSLPGPILPYLWTWVKLGFAEMRVMRLAGPCNQRCPFCNVDDVLEPYFTLKELMAQVDALKEPGRTFFSITGGEPLLSRDLEPLIAHIRKRGGRYVVVQTNGVTLSRPGMAAHLADLGVDHLFISLHSHEALTSQWLTQGHPDDFPRTLEGIQRSFDAGMAVEINTVLVKENLAGFPGFCAFLLAQFPRLGATTRHLYTGGVSVSVANPFGRAWTNRRRLLPTYGELRGPLNQGLDLLRNGGVCYNNPVCGVPFCHIPNHVDASIEWAMAVIPELGLPANPMKMQLPPCQICAYRDICPGVWKPLVEHFGPRGMVSPLAAPTAPLAVSFPAATPTVERCRLDTPFWQA